MQVRDVMQRKLKTVAGNATVAEAIDALIEAHVSALPVVDTFGRAVGVISAREILAAEGTHRNAAEREQLFDETLVLEVMQAWPATVTPDTELRSAADRMLQDETQRLFVEDSGALVGVVSLTDVARAYVPAPLHCACEEDV